jgi:hypothetical protein
MNRENNRIITSSFIALFLVSLFLRTVFFTQKRQKPDSIKPKVAIVLDDWGYNTRNVSLLDSIEIPLTLAVLPNLPYSTRIARHMHNNKHREIILHMPMEPKDNSVPLEKDTLLCSMGKDSIIALLANAKQTVPYIKGLSNHMGSKATENKRFAAIIMSYLNKEKLYFLDSMVTPGTVCETEAKKTDTGFIKRDVFLDNISDTNYILSQLDKLIDIAVKNGSSVGIGHDRKLTLEAIRKKSQQLKDKDSIEFVLLSELVKKN